MTREELAYKHLDKIYKRMKVAIANEDFHGLRQLHDSFERTIVVLQAEAASKKTSSKSKKLQRKG